MLRVTLAAAPPRRGAAVLARSVDSGPQQKRRFSVAHDQIDFAAALAHVGGDKPQSFAFQPATRGSFPRVASLFTR
ncbi:hypothetical protein KY1_06773 [Salmonella enterica subsp. enterica serovar Cerro str. FSL R8-0235]|nr:hypothetical protein KY1_06773 [Salmonella enterica subsp. enterica serovar Cerro str. FSL R8-0235]